MYNIDVSRIRRMATIISLANGKGGVAKTTTCIALGSSLAEMGYRVLLIDLDPSANLTAGLGVLTEHILDFSQDLFIPERAHIIRPTETAYQNLDILPSKGEVAYQGDTLFSSDGTSTDLRLALESIAPNPYDLILFDCPASISSLTLSALNTSDWLIVPTQPEHFSTMALPTMFSLVNRIRQGKNPSLKYRILVTMLDLRLKEHRDILGQLQMWLKDNLYRTRVQIDTHFKESHSQGIPINYAMPFSRGTLQYKDLAYEIVQELKLHPAQPESSDKVEAYLKAHAGSVLLSQDGSGESQPDEHGGYCPHLGGTDDRETIQAYPSAWNKCYRATPVVAPNYNHQVLYCISNNHRSCPLLRKSKKASLPSSMRAPLGGVELFKYFKDWVKAKIS